MLTGSEIKFQWHPTLFVAIGPLAKAILCECVQQIRECWSKTPEFLSKRPAQTDDAVPPFFGFIAFLCEESPQAAESLTSDSAGLVKVITDQVSTGNDAWQYIRPELQRIASININTRYHRFKGFENEYRHIDFILVAAPDEVAETSLLFEPALALADQFTINRRIGIFLLNQFENLPLNELKKRREAIMSAVEALEKQSRNSLRPFTSCLLLDECNTSGLKFYRRIDAVRMVGSFLFSLTSTSLGSPLKRILTPPKAEESFFSFGLVKRSFSNQEVIRTLAARLFTDFTEILFRKSEDNSDSRLEQINQQLQTQLDFEANALNKELIDSHLTEVHNLIQHLVHSLENTPRKSFSSLLSEFQVFRTFIMQNLSKWSRTRQSLNKRILIIEERLKHLRPLPYRRPYRLIWPSILWTAVVLVVCLSLYYFSVKLQPVYWMTIVLVWISILYVVWKLSVRYESVIGSLHDNPQYQQLVKELDTLRKKYEITVGVFSEFERMIHQVESSQVKVLLAIEQLRAKQTSFRNPEEGSWLVHNVLWTAELDQLYKTIISNPDDKLRQVLSERFSISNFIQDGGNDLADDLLTSCQQEFKMLESLSFEQALSLCNTNEGSRPIQTFLNALYRSSNFLWRLDLQRISACHIVFGYGDFWSSDFINEVKQTIGSIEAVPVSGSRDITMIQIAQGIQLSNFYDSDRR